MDKVENQCALCNGLGWYVSQFYVVACRKCKMFEHDNAAFKFVITICEQWQRTIALIFATRLLAEAVPVSPVVQDESNLCSVCGAEYNRCEHPVSAEETSKLGAVCVGVDETVTPYDTSKGPITSLTLVCSKCGAAFGCCDHKGVDMVDPNTRPFIDKRKEHIANYVAPLWPANVHIPTEQEFKEKRILREVDAERISELPASIVQTK